MPRERMAWRPQETWGAVANGLLRRLWELADGSTRHAVQTLTASATAVLSWPGTLILVDTSGGSVTVTLPSAAAHIGYHVHVKKMTAGHTVTLAAASGETIDGSASFNWSTHYQSATVISTGAGWVLV